MQHPIDTPNQAATADGAINVHGTTQGNVVGVNYGTLQAHLDSQPDFPSLQPMPTVAEALAAQHTRLLAHRRTLATYLEQQARFGGIYTPPGIVDGIRETRAAIHQIKAILHAWEQPVEDHPDDEA
jgi:hypothetical protein